MLQPHSLSSYNPNAPLGCRPFLANRLWQITSQRRSQTSRVQRINAELPKGMQKNTVITIGEALYGKTIFPLQLFVLRWRMQCSLTVFGRLPCHPFLQIAWQTSWAKAKTR